MPKASAGILVYRFGDRGLEVLLVHPGGPFWARRDEGAWSIPKGEIEPGEDPFAAALREFHEETGVQVDGDPIALAPVRQRGGKTVHAFAIAGDLDPSTIESNTFEIEWPPGSGRKRAFPEVDRAAWFPIDEAKRRIVPGQRPLLNELERRLAGPS